MPKAKDEKTEDRCPNCGCCPHCGQSKKPPQIVKEVIREPRPYRPWGEWRPAVGPYYGEGIRFWNGKTICQTTEGVKPESISMSSSYGASGPEGNQC